MQGTADHRGKSRTCPDRHVAGPVTNGSAPLDAPPPRFVPSPRAEALNPQRREQARCEAEGHWQVLLHGAVAAGDHEPGGALGALRQLHLHAQLVTDADAAHVAEDSLLQRVAPL